jgi:membrane associated rhomboid family serine protease
VSSTLVLITLTVLVSVAAFGQPNLLHRLILWPPAIARNGQYYRLLSYGFIHADGQHLLFNMLTLYFFGSVMERLYQAELGRFGFYAFYCGGLLVSILPSYLRNRDNPEYRSLGASGAVSAVVFAFILLQPWAMILVFGIPLPAVIYAALYVAYSFYMERRGTDHVNHSAHLWGAAYGVVFTVLMEPRVLAVFVEALRHPPWR